MLWVLCKIVGGELFYVDARRMFLTVELNIIFKIYTFLNNFRGGRCHYIIDYATDVSQYFIKLNQKLFKIPILKM